MGKPFVLVVPDSVDSVSVSLPDGSVFNWNAGKGFELFFADEGKLKISGSELHFIRAAAKPAANTESAPAGKGTGKRKYTRKNKISKKKDAAKAPAAETTNISVDPAYAKKVEALDLGKKGRGRTFALKACAKSKVKTIEDLFHKKDEIKKFKGIGARGKKLLTDALAKYVEKHPRDVKPA